MFRLQKHKKAKLPLFIYLMRPFNAESGLSKKTVCEAQTKSLVALDE